MYMEPSEMPAESQTRIDFIHFWCRSVFGDISSISFLTLFNIATLKLIYQGNYLD